MRPCSKLAFQSNGQIPRPVLIIGGDFNGSIGANNEIVLQHFNIPDFCLIGLVHWKSKDKKHWYGEWVRIDMRMNRVGFASIDKICPEGLQ